MRVASTGLLSWFERKATIVTPSPLLAAVATQQFGKYQLGRGLESWERPAIYTVEAWLVSRWQEARYSAADVPTLLSPSQEHFLWQSIIEREHPALFDPYATASLARNAAKLVAEWHISLDSDAWSETQDAQEFQRWYKLFRRKCEQEGWIARFDLWVRVPKWLGKSNGETTVFLRSDKLTPSFERVRQALGNFAAVETIDAPRPHHRAPAVSFADFNQEIEHAARWARASYEHGSSKSIGIFVPELSKHRALVERTFRNVLYPSRTDVAGSIFRINAAAPLQNHPLVASALLLLELARPRIHHADACAILRCPFIRGAAAERSARALADVELRKRRELDVSLRDMELATKNCPLLALVWSALRGVLREKRHRRELPAWSEFFADLLEAVGWPGDTELTTAEQEIMQAWQDALSGLAALGLVSPPVPYDEAVVHLRRLLSSRDVNLADWFSPIQILDGSEAAGLEFDIAVATGLSEETWPLPVNISPLVPTRLQRAHQVPGSSPATVHEQRERATRQLFGVAPVLLATYSGRLSPAAEPFVEPPQQELSEWRGKLPRESYVPAAFEEFEDSHAPPYSLPEARGGASLIKAQSLCPFRGFAEFRLSARLPEDACFGYDSRDRGGFLHTALKIVWQQLKTQRQLRFTESEELRAIVQDAVAQAVADSQSSPFYQLATRAERERLEELILEWLEVERNRKYPFTVETVEENLYYELAGLRLRLRLDRIDRLDNGHLVLIDYKSGKQTRPKLEGERPAEPQLLVYATAVREKVDGIFFAQLKPRELRAVGFSRDRHFSDQTATVRKDWDSYLANSRSNVEKIAAGFLEGFAAVDPIKGACEYCNLKPLCRINEQIARDGEDDFD